MSNFILGNQTWDVANLFFDGGLYLIPAATYSLIMYATSLSFIYFLRRSK